VIAISVQNRGEMREDFMIYRVSKKAPTQFTEIITYITFCSTQFILYQKPWQQYQCRIEAKWEKILWYTECPRSPYPVHWNDNLHYILQHTVYTVPETVIAISVQNRGEMREDFMIYRVSKKAPTQFTEIITYITFCSTQFILYQKPWQQYQCRIEAKWEKILWYTECPRSPCPVHWNDNLHYILQHTVYTVPETVIAISVQNRGEMREDFMIYRVSKKAPTQFTEMITYITFCSTQFILYQKPWQQYQCRIEAKWEKILWYTECPRSPYPVHWNDNLHYILQHTVYTVPETVTAISVQFRGEMRDFMIYRVSKKPLPQFTEMITYITFCSTQFILYQKPWQEYQCRMEAKRRKSLKENFRKMGLPTEVYTITTNRPAGILGTPFTYTTQKNTQREAAWWERDAVTIKKLRKVTIIAFISTNTRSQCPRGLRRAACGSSPAEIVGSNPTGRMNVCLLWVSCVVR